MSVHLAECYPGTWQDYQALISDQHRQASFRQSHSVWRDTVCLVLSVLEQWHQRRKLHRTLLPLGTCSFGPALPWCSYVDEWHRHGVASSAPIAGKQLSGKLILHVDDAGPHLPLTRGPPPSLTSKEGLSVHETPGCMQCCNTLQCLTPSVQIDE